MNKINRISKRLTTKMKDMLGNTFLKNTLLVSGGTAFAQALTIMLSPIVTRVYTPEEYGILSIYMSILTLISVGSTLNYYRAIPIAKKEEDSLNLIALSFLILLLFTFIVFIIINLFDYIIFSLLNSPLLLKYKYFIPLGVFLLGIYTILMHWSMRVKDFKTIAYTKLSQSILSNVGKVILGIVGLGVPGLLASHILSQSGGISRLLKPLIIKRNELIKSINISGMIKNAKEYVNFPLYTTPSGYLYTAGNQAPIIGFSSLYGSTVVGYYGIANTIVNLPISLISTSVSQVYFAEIAEIGKTNPLKIRKLSINLIRKLALIGLIPLIIFLSISPFLFGLVFGVNWTQAGEYAQVLSVLAYIHFVILPIGRVLEVVGRQNVSFIINIIRLIVIIMAFFVAEILNFAPYYTLMLYAAISGISYIVLFISVQIVLVKQTKLI